MCKTNLLPLNNFCPATRYRPVEKESERITRFWSLVTVRSQLGGRRTGNTRNIGSPKQPSPGA